MTMSQGLKVSRSRWMLLASGLLATSSPCDLPAQQGDVMKMTIAPVAPGIHVISGFANGNILVIEGPMDLLLVDAQSMKRVALADSALRTVTRKPVRQVVFTHYHEDHTQGMSHWKTQGAFAVAHQNVAIEMRKDTTITDRDWHRTTAAPEAMPTLEFRDSMMLDVSGSRIWLHHPQPAHTNGDAVVIVPWANVIHTGDLVEPGAPPFIDFWTGGSVNGMIAAAQWIVNRANDSTKIVPGHGPVIDRATVQRHIAMLIALRDQARLALGEGKTEEQFIAMQPAKEWEALLGGPRGAANFVKQVYYGAKREKK
jgi:cyclase